MQSLGFEVSYQPVRLSGQRHLNVIGYLGEGRWPMGFLTHTDTVPPTPKEAWTSTGGRPWSPVIKGRYLYGLGVADVKSDLAAKLAAFSRINANELKRPIAMFATCAEETGLQGAKALAQKAGLQKPAELWVGEPSELRLVTRHKGYLVVEVELKLRHRPKVRKGRRIVFRGKTAHSATPHLGQNALVAALEFLTKTWGRSPQTEVLEVQAGTVANKVPERCELVLGEAGSHGLPLRDLMDWLRDYEARAKRLKRRVSSAFDPPQLSITPTRLRVNGHRLVLTLDHRLMPGQRAEDYLLLMEQSLEEYFKPARFRLKVERNNPALSTASNESIVRSGKRVLREMDLDEPPATKPTCTEAGILAEAWRIPAVVFGPGKSTGNIHRPNERTGLKQIYQAAQFYEKIIRAGSRGT